MIRAVCVKPRKSRDQWLHLFELLHYSLILCSLKYNLKKERQFGKWCSGLAAGELEAGRGRVLCAKARLRESQQVTI